MTISDMAYVMATEGTLLRWPLLHANMTKPDFYATDESLGSLELVLDRVNKEFGIIYKSGPGTSALALKVDGKPAYFNACDVLGLWGPEIKRDVAASDRCDRLRRAYLALKNDRQLDIMITYYDDACDFSVALQNASDGVLLPWMASRGSLYLP